MIPTQSPTALPQVQRAIFQALNGDTLYRAMCAVYDDVPESAAYPYTTIGEAIETPDRTMGQGGHQVLVMLSTYTRDGSQDVAGIGTAGFAPGLAIMRKQTELLVETPLLVEDFDVVMVEVETIETSRAADGVTRIVDARYRLWLEDAA
jgi:hypothetical protein